LQWVVARAANEGHDPFRRVGAEILPQDAGNLTAGDEWTRDLFVMQRADFLQRVREGIMSDVVQQRGVADEEARLPFEILGVPVSSKRPSVRRAR